MSHPPFDPARAVRFDVASGRIDLEEAPERVLVPARALAALCAAAGTETARTACSAIGEPMGRRVARRLGSVANATPEAVVEHLGGEIALCGLGSLGLERWGRAVVLVVDHSPLATDDAGAALLGTVLEAALWAATDTGVRCVPLGRDGERARFLVTGSGGAEKVVAWIASGVSWGDALVRLHEAAVDRRGGA